MLKSSHCKMYSAFFFFFPEHLLAANSCKTLGTVATALTKLSELALFKWPCLGISVVQKRGLNN